MIETIIYIAIFGMVVGSLVSFAMLISSMGSKQHGLSEMISCRSVLGELVSFYTKAAGQVIEPASQATSSVMVLRMRGSGTMGRLYATEGKAYFDDDGTITAMSGDGCSVSGLVFSNLAATGTPAAIKVTGHLASPDATSVEYAFEDDFNFNMRLPF